jgi:hypothetical protein
MRTIVRALVVAAPLVAAFAWFVPSGAEQAEPVPDPATLELAPPVATPPATAPARRAMASSFPDLRPSERIAAYLERAPEPETPPRNPFRFAEPAPRRAAAPRARAVVPGGERAAAADEGIPANADAAVPLTLIGVAEFEGDTPRRVAILSSPSALIHAATGEVLLDRFTVGEVTADSVDVTDTVTARVHRLALR